MNNKDDTVQITISLEVYDELLKHMPYGKYKKNAVINSNTVHITISKELDGDLYSIANMLKASGVDDGGNRSYNKALKWELGLSISDAPKQNDK